MIDELINKMDEDGGKIANVDKADAEKFMKWC